MTEAAQGDLVVRWRSWLRERNRRGLRNALWITLTLYPLFGVLDYLTAPREWLWLLYATRALVTVVTLSMFRVLARPLFDRFVYLLTAGYMVLISFGISMMTVFMGGLASPYYAGLNLTIVGAGLLYVWPPRVVIATNITIILSFVLPNLVLPHRTHELTGISNLFFLVSTAVIAATAQILAYRSQRELLANQVNLELTKQNLERAHDKLKEIDRFKSEFFANITHELKTPLTMMLTPIELLIEGDLGAISEAQRSTLRNMLRNGVKLLRLIGDLLDLSRLEESRLRLRIGEHALDAYLRGLVEQIEPLAQRKGIRMEYASLGGEAMIWCDIERMERVFVNLLANATKFTPPSGVISVMLEDEPDAVVVRVADSGVGFPPEMAGKLFERFFQVDMADTRKHGGAGIGLALAKELVELHGGAIWAASSPGDGATFSVRLRKGRAHLGPDVLDRRAPRDGEALNGQRATDRGIGGWPLHATNMFRLIDIEQATEQRIVERDPDEASRLHSVLVVEDTPDVIRVIHLALHQHFRVLAAPDGAKGFELAVKHRPSLIVTDLMMPAFDGLELTKRLRAEPTTRHIPIVMLTARGAVDDRVRGLDSGVNAYLSKPFSGKELVSTVRSLMAAQHGTAELLLTHQMDSLEVLAGGLAHEIKNPLNYIKNALANIHRDANKVVELANSGRDPEQLDVLSSRIQRMFQSAETGVKRIATTVDLMIRYSREGYSRTLQPYDAFQAVHDVTALVLAASGADVELSVDLRDDGTVECVPEELNQVLTNLIQNAVDAVRSPGGRIAIVGRVDGDSLLLSIADNGIGIAPENQAKIFNAFFTTKDVGRGLGLGLTIAHRCVIALGGKIDVRSRPDEGTEFTLRLPRQSVVPRAYPPSRSPVREVFA